MEWNATWKDPLRTYLAPYEELIGDKRTRKTFEETIRGIMGAGSLICQQIAAHSPMLAKAKKGAQRILRLASGESTQRSELDAKHLTKKLREAAVEHLGQAPEEELWLVADCSDLRKPYATEMPYLMQVPDLDGKGWVPGYRTVNVLGITPGRRGILYHRLFSSQAPGFVSEPAEVQEALETVSQALTPLKASKVVTWITDRGGSRCGSVAHESSSRKSMWCVASTTASVPSPLRMARGTGSRGISPKPNSRYANWLEWKRRWKCRRASSVIPSGNPWKWKFRRALSA